MTKTQKGVVQQQVYMIYFEQEIVYNIVTRLRKQSSRGRQSPANLSIVPVS